MKPCIVQKVLKEPTLYLAVNIYKACRQQMLYNGKVAILSSKMKARRTFNILEEKKTGCELFT